jgi:hypothetical protein
MKLMKTTYPVLNKMRPIRKTSPKTSQGLVNLATGSSL